MIYSYKEIELYNLDNFSTFTNKGDVYINTQFSFDIETSSFFIDKDNNSISISEYEKIIENNPKEEKNYNKATVCYIWQFAINEDVFIGRTLEEYVIFIKLLKQKLLNKKIIVYVHNLSYEFQFIRKYFYWFDVFAIDNRKVLSCKTDFITYKCSYLLSSKSLEKLSEDLQEKRINKLVGDLDYKEIRHSKTLLTENEKQYCINDVLIVNQYIKEQSIIYGRIDKIPLTNTGRVRRFTRKECFKNKKYAVKIHKSLILSPLEFKISRNAFSGGYTHANSLYTNLICKDVSSFDFTSSYPTVMISEKYPMSKGYKIINPSIEEFEKYINDYCVIFTVEYWNIKTKKELQPILSRSKCLKIDNPKSDNGRVFQADYLMTSLTDVDYRNIKDFYTYLDIKIGICYLYKKDYLPKEIINCILKFYGDKTQLKGVEGKEIEYMLSKNMLNSLYGMTVFNPIKNQFIYNNELKEWEEIQIDINDETIEEYNNDKTRFIFYLWGVFVTAYARNNLFSALKIMKNDFIYSDTDSIKIFDKDKYKEYFDNYNNNIFIKMSECLNKYDIPTKLLHPKNNKGIEKMLGVWDYEGDYTYFKTLGAKRYMTVKNDVLDMTVSGLNKNYCLPYLKDMYKDNINILNHFSNSLYIPKEYTGKRIHTYIDDEIECMITDFRGIKSKEKCLSGIHLMESDYDLSLTNDYISFFKYIQKR